MTENVMPPCPENVARAMDACTDAQRARLQDLRALIFDTAAQDDTIGPLTETLKWGEPAYLTDKTRSGSTLRIGPVKGRADRVALFVNCQTRLADRFRDQFGGRLDIQGDRAVLVDVDASLDRDAIAECIALTLTYHRWR